MHHTNNVTTSDILDGKSILFDNIQEAEGEKNAMTYDMNNKKTMKKEKEDEERSEEANNVDDADTDADDDE